MEPQIASQYRGIGLLWRGPIYQRLRAEYLEYQKSSLKFEKFDVVIYNEEMEGKIPMNCSSLENKPSFAEKGQFVSASFKVKKAGNAGITYFSEDEKRGTAKGHILAHSTYNPGTDFTYYWGFGWNHSDMTSYEQWLDHLETFTSQLRSPLTVTIK